METFKKKRIEIVLEAQSGAHTQQLRVEADFGGEADPATLELEVEGIEEGLNSALGADRHGAQGEGEQGENR